MRPVSDSNNYDTEEELMKPTWSNLSEAEKFYVRTYVRNLKLDIPASEMRQLMFEVNKIIDKNPDLNLWEAQ